MNADLRLSVFIRGYNQLPWDELEILFALVIRAILRDEYAVRELRSEISGRHMYPVSLCHVVDRVAGDDAE